MDKIWKSWTSTNGRYGMDVLAPEDFVQVDGVLQEGVVSDLGTVANRRVLRFTPKPGAGTYILFGADGLDGGTIIEDLNLQSSNSASVSIVGRMAVAKYMGYKGRSISYTLYKDGKAVELQEAQLLALGLIKPSVKPVEIPPPPPMPSAMADAFAALGL